VIEECKVSLTGEQDSETIGEFYARIQRVTEAFYEIATSKENIGDFFEFSDNGVVDKRKHIKGKCKSPLLESGIEATEKETRTGKINEQIQLIKNIEEVKTQEIQKDLGE